GGSTRDKTLATVRDIATLGHEAAPHLSCVGSTRGGIAQILDTYRAQKIRRLVALRGDLPSGTATAGEFRYAAELIGFIRQTEGFLDDAESIRAFGLDVVTHLCRRLIAGGAPGIHFYTLNQSALSLEICRRLAS